MPYWRLYYHAVWATRGRAPLLDAGRLEVVRRAIRAVCRDEGVIVHAVGGVADHVHVVASVPPALAVATVVGKWKGASSHAVNDEFAGGAKFAWQSEYGVLSFGDRALPDVLAYANDQPARHAANTTWPRLEHTDRPDRPDPSEPSDPSKRPDRPKHNE